MTTLRNLNRAVQSAEFPSHEWAQAVREMLAEVAERMEAGKTAGGLDFSYEGISPGSNYHSEPASAAKEIMWDKLSGRPVLVDVKVKEKIGGGAA